MSETLSGDEINEGRPVVCDGGPWDGWWYDRASWERQISAARRLGHPADTIGGRVLAYQCTGRTKPNPLNANRPKARQIPDGEVWRWTGG